MAFDLEKIIEFCRNHPVRPGWFEKDIRYFCTRLVTSPEHVIGIERSGSLVAVAVLIDQVRNLANDAKLEFLGWNPIRGKSEDFAEIISQAQAMLPGARSGISMSHHSSYPVAESFLLERGFRPYYSYFYMECFGFDGKDLDLPEGFNWTLPEADQFEKFAQMRGVIFKDSIDVNTPLVGNVTQSILSGGDPLKVLVERGDWVGFVRVTLDAAQGVGELRTLGLLPSHRQMGLGKYLVRMGLSELQQRGIAHAKLSVAAANAQALGLYQRQGFTICDQFACLRFERR